MGHVNIAKLTSLLVKLHKSRSVWLCVHPKPNRTSSSLTSDNNDNSSSTPKQIKLVRYNGSLEVYNHPVIVSDLTKDFPKHKICRSDSLYIGQKTPVLSETESLKLGLNYFLLPSDFFQNDLSFLTIASLQKPLKKTVATHQPFHILKGETGERFKIRVSEDFMSEMMMEGRRNKEIQEEDKEGEGRVCTTVKLKKDYVQLVGLRKWKPKLETITETKAMKVEKKMKKRKRFSVMKKRSKESQVDSSSSKRKLQSKFKSKANKSRLA